MNSLERKEHKKPTFSNVNENLKDRKERIFRKTQTHELIERTFTTQPKYRRRIRRGHTIVIERCQDIMEALWQDGYRQKCTRKDLDRTVFLCVGCDYRTRRQYIGFTKIMKSGHVKRYDGYLERLGYIKEVKPNLFVLNHFKVNRPYHYHEEFSPPIKHSIRECVRSKEEMYVGELGEEERYAAMVLAAASDGDSKLVCSSSILPHTQNSRVKVKHNRYASKNIDEKADSQ